MKAALFLDDGDYRSFVDLLGTSVARFELPLLGYCVMPNHWHLVVLSPGQIVLSRALHWLTSVHAHQWAKAHERKGPGHVYQGRFHSIPVQPGINMCRVLRYVERNASAAGLAARAEEWPWGSAYQRRVGMREPRLLPQPFLPARQWLDHINAPHVDHEIGRAIRKNLPIGDEDWVRFRRERLGLPEPRARGRPPKPV